MRRRLALLTASKRLCISLVSALPMSVVGLAVTAGVAQTPVAAATNCANWNTCRWTQYDNGNWQPNQNMNPYCGACYQWWQRSNAILYYWNAFRGTGSFLENDVNWAAHTWTSVPEDTPSFSEDMGSGGNDATYYNGGQSYGPDICASTFITGSQAQGSVYYISYVNIYLNSNKTYYDGRPPSNAPAGSCDAKSTFLHETGHSYGEGHSSVQSDVMYPHNNGVYAIDQDAHNMLAAVYGYPGSASCNSCQADIQPPPLPITIQPMTLAQLQQALANKANAAAAAANDLVQDGSSTEQNAANDAASLTTCPPTRCDGPPPSP